MLQGIKRQLAVGTALVGGFLAPVYAAVPADVTTALTDMKSDALTVAGVVLAAVIAVAAFKFMKRGI